MKAIVKSTGQLVDVFKLDDNEYVRLDTDLHITYTEGELDFDKASSILLEEFRNLKIGKISLERTENA